MKWTFKWAKELESGIYYHRLLPEGFVKPEDTEPPTDGLDFYVDAFRELSTCRPGGMGLLPIPFTAIVEYSRIYELEDLEEFAYVIRSMDDTFIKEYVADQQRRGNDGGGNADAKNNNKR